MKFEFNGQMVCEKICYDILMELQYERPTLKGQRSTLTFGTYFKAIVSLG